MSGFCTPCFLPIFFTRRVPALPRPTRIKSGECEGKNKHTDYLWVPRCFGFFGCVCWYLTFLVFFCWYRGGSEQLVKERKNKINSRCFQWHKHWYAERIPMNIYRYAELLFFFNSISRCNKSEWWMSSIDICNFSDFYPTNVKCVTKAGVIVYIRYTYYNRRFLWSKISLFSFIIFSIRSDRKYTGCSQSIKIIIYYYFQLMVADRFNKRNDFRNIVFTQNFTNIIIQLWLPYFISTPEIQRQLSIVNSICFISK